MMSSKSASMEILWNTPPSNEASNPEMVALSLSAINSDAGLSSILTDR